MALKFRPNHLSPREPLVDSGTILYPTLLLFLSLSIWYNTAIGRDKLVLNINCKISIDKKAVFVMELWSWISMRYVIMNPHRIFLMVGILVFKFLCHKFRIKRNDLCFCHPPHGKANVKSIHFIIIQSVIEIVN